MPNIFDQTSLAIIGIAFGAIGIIVSIAAGLWSRVRIEPCLYHDSKREVSKLSDTNRKIRVLYGRKTVSEVTTTRVWFFNRGKRPLKREHIPVNAPLIIEIRDHHNQETPEILDFRIAKTSKDTCNFTAKRTQSPNQLLIDFDYLDYNQGAKLEIQHNASDYCGVTLLGEILGPKAKTFQLAYTQPSTRTIHALRKAFLFGVFILSGLAFSLSFAIPFIESRDQPKVISVASLEEQLPAILQRNGIDSLRAVTLTSQAIQQSMSRVHIPNPLYIIAVILVTAIWVYTVKARRRIPDSLFE